jgi:hypothetical protein
VGRLIEESRDAMLGADVNSEGYITDCTSKIDQSNNISHTINMEKQKQLMQIQPV